MKYSKYNFQYYNLLYSIKCYTFEIFTIFFYFVYFNIRHLLNRHLLNRHLLCDKMTYDTNDIIFFTSYGHMPGNIPWDGNSLAKGIGGSEYCIIKLAEAMAEDNINNKKIIVYCDCLENITINNVHYIKSCLFDYSVKYNNIIIWRLPFVEWFISYNKLTLWVHDGSLIPALDFFYRINTLKYFINPDINIVVPSQYIYEDFDKYRCNRCNRCNKPNMYKHIFKINHGFEKYSGEIIPQRIKNTFIWHTNLNRGLDIFLKHFHFILKEFPEAKIYICGEKYAYYNKNNNYITELLNKYDNCIIYTNKLKHEKLLELLNKCEFFCYTCNIIESFSLCTWEAGINGCIPVVYDIGAISEIKEVDGVVIEDKNITLFIETLLQLMKNEDKKKTVRETIVNNINKQVKYKWSDVKLIWYETVLMV